LEIFRSRQNLSTARHHHHHNASPTIARHPLGHGHGHLIRIRIAAGRRHAPLSPYPVYSQLIINNI
jgi:hypothetical protein